MFVYREVVEPERLVFAPSLLADRDAVDEHSVVTVTFADLGGQTEMTFHAVGFTEAGERAGAQDGWAGSFDRLADHLAAG